MAAFIEEKDRTVIPRWRLFSLATQLGELDLTARGGVAPADPHVLSKLLRDWSQKRDIWHAADLLSAAFVIDRPELAHEAASYILSHRDKVSKAAARLAELVHDGNRDTVSAEPNWKKVIRDARAALYLLPRNAIRWTDLALAHTVLGNFEQAKRAIDVALNLAPENRFVLRSAVRCFVHRNELGKAQAVLHKALGTQHDPWLLSAELAVASARKKSSKLTKSARAMVDSEDFHPSQTSELASALATIELGHGAERKAKLLFRQSLVCPTENSAAQAKWSAIRSPSVLSPGDKERLENLDIPRLFEMRAVEHFKDGRFNEALQYALLWLEDQPFSVRPAYLSAYLASLLGDYARAIEIGKRALSANPNDWLLLNNLAFHLASNDEVEEAAEVLSHLEQLELQVEQEVVVTATRGLLAYRTGDVARGRALYVKALDDSSHNRLPRQRGVAAIFLAREELLVAGAGSTEFHLLAHELADSLDERDIQEWLRQLDEQFQRAGVGAALAVPSIVFRP